MRNVHDLSRISLEMPHNIRANMMRCLAKPITRGVHLINIVSLPASDASLLPRPSYDLKMKIFFWQTQSITPQT